MPDHDEARVDGIRQGRRERIHADATRAVQITAEAGSWDEAYAVLRGQEAQVGYLAGRMSPRGGGWFVQTFHEPGPVGCWLPDGCRHVVIPAGLAASLGLEG